MKAQMNTKQILAELKQRGSQYNLDGMKRFGINTDKAFGVNMPLLRSLAKIIGKNHELAQELWNSGYHEARHLAGMIDDPKLVTKSQMNKWVKEFNSWDICDGMCSNLFRKTPFAIEKIYEWCPNEKEFIRRAGFSLICYVTVHHKTRDDEEFTQFFELIKKYSMDERNFVRKAVNWALRTIGKRSHYLNEEAIKVAREIKTFQSKASKWIAADAIRELTDPKTVARIKK